MIVPSIDLMGGDAVQLIGGKELEINAGDPRPIAERFGRVGDIAVIDLDAALSQGSNADVIKDLLPMARCRVGGGIRDVDTAIKWLDAGAHRIILGTAARPDVLEHLPAERVIAALDAVEGEVVVEGWTTKTGASILDRMRELRPYVGGFLVTFVEKEGRMQGTDMERVAGLVEAAAGADLTIAGGVTTPEELAELDRLGVDAQVGMALYSNHLHLADAFAAPMTSDRADGLWPTVVSNARGETLGLAYSNLESLRVALDRGVGAYHSRKRGLWVKGETSGNTQALKSVAMDCDRDALHFVVEQSGPFCHLGTDGCFGNDSGLTALERTVHARVAEAPEGSYTKRLLDDSELLAAKLIEEAQELAEAKTKEEVAWEAADLIYFASVAMARAGVNFADVEKVLDQRSLKVVRRKGDAKEVKK